jgi:hypothetical protein
MAVMTGRYLGHKVQAQETVNGWLARLNGMPLGHFVKSNEALDYAMDEAYLTEFEADRELVGDSSEILAERDAIERDRKRLAEVKAIEESIDPWSCGLECCD